MVPPVPGGTTGDAPGLSRAIIELVSLITFAAAFTVNTGFADPFPFAPDPSMSISSSVGSVENCPLLNPVYNMT